MGAELLRDRPWEDRRFKTPPEIEWPASMLNHAEKRMLYWTTLYAYDVAGVIADLGAFLGGSTVCFAAALRARGVESPVIHSYDRFRLGAFEREQYFATDPPPDDNIRPLYNGNVESYRDLVAVHHGDILDEHWNGAPIEILFVDIAKTPDVWDHVLREFFPALIPGKSIVILQDYLYEKSGPWHHVTMEKLAACFEPVTDTRANSMVFGYRGGLTRESLKAAEWRALPYDEKVALMNAAFEKLDAAGQDLVTGVRQRVLDREGVGFGDPARRRARAASRTSP